MQNYDIIIFTRGRAPREIKTSASSPTIAFDLALRQALQWPADEQAQVIGLTLKLEKKDA